MSRFQIIVVSLWFVTPIEITLPCLTSGSSNISLRMQNVDVIENGIDYFFLDTGSPHYVKFVKDIESINVFEEGQKIRCNERFKNDGTNVNFVQIKNQKLYIRTYERGVEDETLACGTGVVASVLSAYEANLISKNSVEIITMGGDLKVDFEDWHVENAKIDLSKNPPEGVFYNRMSARSHSRGHRYAPEKTKEVLEWLKRDNRRVINNLRALELEISKINDYLMRTTKV